MGFIPRSESECKSPKTMNRFNSLNNSLWRRERRVLRLFSLLVVGFLTIVGFYSASVSGPIWDDQIEIIGLLDQIGLARNILSGRLDIDYESAIATNLEFYGIINKLGGLLLYRLFSPFLRVISPQVFDDEMIGAIVINKFLCILFFALGAWYTYKLAKVLGCKFPSLAPLLLCSTPFIVGHSWLNIKDIPFASFYTAFTYYCVCIIKSRFNNYSYSKNIGSFLHCELFAVLFGILASSCRPAFMPVATITLFLTYTVSLMVSGKDLSLHGAINSMALPFRDVVLLLLGTILFIPASWLSPLEYFKKAIAIHANHPWGGCMLIEGECNSINSSYTIINYLWQWLSVKLPIVQLSIISISFLLVIAYIFLLIISPSSLGLLSRFSSVNIYGQFLGIMFIASLQVFTIPVFAILRNSTTYDGLRHWIFVFPALYAMCSAILSRNLWDVFKSTFARRLLLTLLITGISLNAIDIALLSPYSYVYINELSRSRLDHSNIDLDYWGASSFMTTAEISKRKWNISNIEDNGSAEHFIYPRIYLEGSKFPAPNSPNVGVALVHKRFASQTKRLDNYKCLDKFSISRKQLFGRELNLASVGYNCRSADTYLTK